MDILVKIISKLYSNENIFQSVKYLALLHTNVFIKQYTSQLFFLKKSPTDVQIEINFRSETDSTPHK